eukprot:3937610-Rhodomonas_salina.3
MSAVHFYACLQSASGVGRHAGVSSSEPDRRCISQRSDDPPPPRARRRQRHAAECSHPATPSTPSPLSQLPPLPLSPLP